MTIRCSVCKLDSAKRAAIDAALRGNASLIEISAKCGISKSALQRHSKHLAGPYLVTKEAPVEAMTPDPAATPVSEPVSAEIAKPEEQSIAAPTGELTKQSLLERLEHLWSESMDGLEAAKESVVITKPNGVSIEVPGDLRARAAFVREGRQVLELQGEVSGAYSRGQPMQVGVIQVVVPAVTSLEAQEQRRIAEAAVVEIAMPKR
jgi:hypothetical protein